MCSSFPARQRLANERYYSSRGAGIYSDFSTFAQGKALATSGAIGFIGRFGKTPGDAVVCEYGVGDGNFAKVFLDEVKRRDAPLYRRTRYHLFDFSNKMLSAAKKTLASHRNCSFARFDAASETPSVPFDYCRMSELLSDLPAEMHRKGERAGQAAEKFLSRTDDGRKIPFPFAAGRFLLSLCRCGKPGFLLDIFDYGFYSAEDIFRHPHAEWNRLVARKYGKQVTADLNFTYLSAILSSEEIPHSVEPQKSYCERMLGKKLRLAHTKKGLEYTAARQGGFDEDDGFYHLEVRQ